MTTGLVLVALGLAAGTVLLSRVRTPVGPPVEVRASVVVPARDEVRNLPRLLPSIGPVHEVLVVDDGSTDGTADVARAHGATVLTTAPAPPGWLGKPWACSTGAAAATGDVLVFVDADVWFGPGGLDRVLAAHAAAGRMLSVQPFHATERAHEQASAFPSAVTVMATGAFGPRPSGRIAFGPCIVVDRAAYEAAGGHGAVRGEVIDDIHLARALGGAEARFGGDAVRYRMYPDGLRPLVEGWTKNLSGGARLAPPLAAIGAVLWVCAAATAGTDGIEAAVRGDLVSSEVAVYVATALHVAWVLRRIGSFRWWTAAAFPLPLLAFAVLFVRSLAARVLRRRVTWRGRRIDLA